MELKSYLRAMVARWWIVLPTLLITFAASVAFTLMQTPMYEATSTYVVKTRVSPTDDKNLLSALDTMTRNPIASTFGQVANSRLVRTQAADDLGLSGDQLSALTVNGRAVVGTNVLLITVQGPDPAVARDFSTAIGVRTAANVRHLYETYELQLLDQAPLPSAPVKPNVPLNLALGATLGLLLGAGLAFLSEYLQSPDEDAPDEVPLPTGPMEGLDARHKPRRRALDNLTESSRSS